MTESKQELSIEQHAIIALSIILFGGGIMGAFFLPIFDTALAIEFNHAMISFLPDSFDSLKFASNESEVFQKVQLVLRNLPLVPVVFFYCGAYCLVLSTVNERPLQKSVAYFFVVYGGFYAMGSSVSQLLNIST